jgi:Fur family ferric uptake transcriptional regulator
MICLECGHIFEFFSPHLEAIQEQLAGEHNFKIYRHRLELYGICTDSAECQARKEMAAREKTG